MPLVSDHIKLWPASKQLDKQSVQVPGTKRPGQTAHYRNAIWGLIDENTPGSLRTVDEIFTVGMKSGRDASFLGEREIISRNPLKYAPVYTWITYGQADIRRRYIGSALHSLFQKGELGSGEYPTVGIWFQNRPEWQLIDIANASYQKVSVSLYDTLGNDSVGYIINHANLTVVFTTSDHVPTLLRLKSEVPLLKMIVVVDKISPDVAKLLKAWADSLGIVFQELVDFEAYGKANLIDPLPAYPELVVSICYTSGTTNNPKGVILTHKNLAVATQAQLYGWEFREGTDLFSFLPLAHIYGRICELSTIAVGGTIGYFTGDPLRLLEDAQILKPTFFPSVPRILNRIYQAIMAGGSVPGLKGKIFQKAVVAKQERLRTTGELNHALWDRVVFRKIQALLGGRVEFVSTGSAPISSEVLDFMKITFGCDILEGCVPFTLEWGRSRSCLFIRYGMTETSATCTRTIPGDIHAVGTVGPPIPSNEIKLVDVPTMGYMADDKPNPRGELCVRGANCFSVYYKDEKNTKETVDDQGWVHTGDIAELDACGRVRIIDRVKNIMKLAQGEYVALEKIESIFSGVPEIAQILVYGDSLQSYLVAVVVPDPVQLGGIVSKVLNKNVLPMDGSGLAAACEEPAVNEYYLQLLNKASKKGGLKGFEIVKRIHLSMIPFSIETNTLTPTMKIRRKDGYNLHKVAIDAMYALGEPAKL